MLASRYASVILGVALAGTHCLGQHADFTVAHDDPDGIVLPGQTVSFELRMTWTGAFQILRLSGDVSASGDLGVASGLIGPTPGGLFAPWSSSLGTPAGGSVDDVNLVFTPAFFIPQPPPCVSLWPSGDLGPFLSWQWTASATPTPTTVNFNFLPDPGTTGVWASLDPTPVPVPLSTTFHGTSLAVVPAPTALAALVGGVFLAPRRRT